jgi:hypothetical protein
MLRIFIFKKAKDDSMLQTAFRRAMLLLRPLTRHGIKGTFVLQTRLLVTLRTAIHRLVKRLAAASFAKQTFL